MGFKRIALAAVTLTVAAAPMTALADPDWGDGDHYEGWHGDHGWRHHEWREHEWREHEWREHEWREHHGWPVGWGYGYGWGRCHWETQGYYNPWGVYEYRQVRVCD